MSARLLQGKKEELMTSIIDNLLTELERNVRPASFPVGVKLAREGDEISQKARHPLKDIGNPIAVCQGLNLARTFGWTVVFGKEDHGCPVGSIAAGHKDPERFLSGAAADLYQDDGEAARQMEASYPRNPVDSVKEIWISPLRNCEFEPDLAVVYGNPAQMIVLIHAANYGHGPGIRSISTGRFGCSTWIAGAIQSGEYTYALPGSAERVFAGTQDHEMSFIVPGSKFASLTEGLREMRKKGSYRYPVTNMNLLKNPSLPGKYYSL
jgi:uncharacterized protein (DUF169 family)